MAAHFANGKSVYYRRMLSLLFLSTTDVVFALVFRTLPDSKSKGNFPLIIIIVIIKETSAHQKSRYADLRGRYFDIKADSKT